MGEFPAQALFFNYDGSGLAEDRATLGSDPSADPGAKTEAGCRRMPRWGLKKQRTSGLAESGKSNQGMFSGLNPMGETRKIN